MKEEKNTKNYEDRISTARVILILVTRAQKKSWTAFGSATWSPPMGKMTVTVRIYCWKCHPKMCPKMGDMVHMVWTGAQSGAQSGTHGRVKSSNKVSIQDPPAVRAVVNDSLKINQSDQSVAEILSVFGFIHLTNVFKFIHLAFSDLSAYGFSCGYDPETHKYLYG